MENALVAQHAWSIDIDDRTQEVFQFGWIQRAFRLENEALHVVVMVMVVPAFVLMGWVVAVFAMVMVVPLSLIHI